MTPNSESVSLLEQATLENLEDSTESIPNIKRTLIIDDILTPNSEYVPILEQATLKSLASTESIPQTRTQCHPYPFKSILN